MKFLYLLPIIGVFETEEPGSGFQIIMIMANHAGIAGSFINV